MMDSTINGRTPEEIKKGLGCCPLCNKSCPYHKEKDCYEKLHYDALDYIQQLEAERDEAWKVIDGLNAQIGGMVEVLESMKRKYSSVCKERDAAEDINQAAKTGCLCYVCHHNDKGYCRAFDIGIFECVVTCGQYKWRGVEGAN